MSSRSSQRDHWACTLSALKSQPCSVYRLCPTLCGTRSMASTRGKRGWSRREHASFLLPCLARPVMWSLACTTKEAQLAGCSHLNAAARTATHIIDSMLPSTAA